MHCFCGGCLFFELRNNIIYNFSGICYQERMELFRNHRARKQKFTTCELFYFCKNYSVQIYYSGN